MADSRPEDVAARDVLHLPERSLVLLTGLPGAGKTTLLRRLTGTQGLRALDSEDVAAHLHRLPVPYHLLRPFVHALHLLHVAIAVHGGVSCLLTTDPYTSPRRRQLLRGIARLSGRSLHVVLIDASPEQARDGRLRRGRDLPAARAARHERRVRLLPSGDVHRRLTRGEAARTVAVVGPEQAWSPTESNPFRTTGSSTMPAPRARRRADSWIPVGATLLGLWFGITAPDVSPVLQPPSAVAGAPGGIADADADADADGDGDGGEPDGPEGRRR